MKSIEKPIRLPLEMFRNSYLPKSPKERAECICLYAKLVYLERNDSALSGSPHTWRSFSELAGVPTRTLRRHCGLMSKSGFISIKHSAGKMRISLPALDSGGKKFQIPVNIALDQATPANLRATVIAIYRQAYPRELLGLENLHLDFPTAFITSDLKVTRKTLVNRIGKLVGAGQLRAKFYDENKRLEIDVSPENTNSELASCGIRAGQLRDKSWPVAGSKTELKSLSPNDLASPLVLTSLVPTALERDFSKLQKNLPSAQTAKSSDYEKNYSQQPHKSVPEKFPEISKVFKTENREKFLEETPPRARARESEIPNGEISLDDLLNAYHAAWERATNPECYPISVPAILADEEISVMAKRKYEPEPDGFDFMADRRRALEGSNNDSDESVDTQGPPKEKKASEWGTQEFLRYFGDKYWRLTRSKYPNLISGKNLSLMKHCVMQQPGESDAEHMVRKVQVRDIIDFMFENWQEVKAHLKFRDHPTVSLFYNFSDKIGMLREQKLGTLTKGTPVYVDEYEKLPDDQRAAMRDRIKAYHSLGQPTPAELRDFEEADRIRQKNI